MVQKGSLLRYPYAHTVQRGSLFGYPQAETAEQILSSLRYSQTVANQLRGSLKYPQTGADQLPGSCKYHCADPRQRNNALTAGRLADVTTILVVELVDMVCNRCLTIRLGLSWNRITRLVQLLTLRCSHTHETNVSTVKPSANQHPQA